AACCCNGGHMANTIEVKVPDIGDYKDVPVIEVLVAVGDTVKKDQGLVTLESDKATLEVPSSAEGVVKEVKAKVGDRLSEGSVVVVLEAAGAAAAEAPKAAAPAAAAPAPAPAAPDARARAPELEAPSLHDYEDDSVVGGSRPGGSTGENR